MSLTFLLRTPPGFAWSGLMRLAGHADRDWVNRVEDRSFVRLFTAGTRLVLMRCDPDDGHLRIRLDCEGEPVLDSQLEPRFQQLAAHMFALDQGWGEIAAILGQDPVLASRVVHTDDFRPFRPPSVFEALVDAVLGQQVHRHLAQRLRNHLVESFGASKRAGSEVYYAFPTPARLANASVGLLRELQLSARKAEYVIGLARRFCRPFTLTRDRDADLARLMQLSGIGAWSAEYALMQGTGANDVVPAGDAFLQAFVGRMYGFGEKATEAQVRGVARNWRPFRSWGTYFVWYGMTASEAPAPPLTSTC